jgi:hypothetical protein
MQKTRNPKHEIRNKSKIQSKNAQNEQFHERTALPLIHRRFFGAVSNGVCCGYRLSFRGCYFGHLDFRFWICFGFRIS